MAEAVLSATLGTLGNLLLEEAKFLPGVSDQVREIRWQFEMMKSFLKDADRRQYADETIRTWVRRVRRLAYRTEVILETYGVEVVSMRGWGMENMLKRFAFIFCKCFALHNVGEEIVAIKSEITILNESRQTFGLSNLNEGESSKEAKERRRLRRQTYAHQDEEHFVGMEDDIRELVSLITDDERDHRVISIWGIGGLGKTTLARKIFNHMVETHSFESFAWVCITQQCEINKVLQDILGQLGNSMKGDTTAILVRELYNVLERKKCLVVLDDIWKIEDWEILCPAFPARNMSSKVLLTTRTGEVATTAGHRYKLNYLTAEEGWELLQRKALIKGKERDIPAFERIGKEIVDKCGRLPLAISVLGGILRERSSPREWEMVSTNIDSYLERGKGNQGASNSVPKVLGLSYDELPYYLKPCFLYMGSYGEDRKISVVQLYQLWIAEGLVLSEDRRGEESMMDVAERYLDELASRCMVEIEMDEESADPMSKWCRLHDVMRELCLAKGKEEEFLKVIDFSSSNQSLPAMDDLSSLSHDYYVRRLGMNIKYEESRPTKQEILEAFKQVKGQYVRALFLEENLKDDVLFGIGGYVPVGSIVKQFKLLRVLRLERCGLELPGEISQLIYLRYLSVYGSKVTKLPSSISNLSYLQTLDLRVYWESRIYLPNIFWKMKRLNHIYLPFVYEVSEKLEFKDMSELETLHGFQSTLRTPGHLSGLTNLRYFTGSFDAHAFSQFEDEIHSWKNIKWLKLQITNSCYSDFKSDQGPALLRKLLLWENLNALDIRNIPIGNFPPYQPNFCPNLSDLYLDNTKIEEDPMQFLKQLPKLRNLILLNNAFLGEEMFCDARAFPRLTYLCISSLPNLMKWRVDEGAMPNFSCLSIFSCRKLETITEGLNLSALKGLWIDEVPEEFKKKYKMLHEQERKKLNG